MITQGPQEEQPERSSARCQPFDAGRPGPERVAWQRARLRRGVVRCSFVVVFAIPSLPGRARAAELEGELGLGIGITSIGGRRSTGGITLMPNGSIGWRFSEWASVRYRNTVLVFNLNAIPWIGVIDMNTAVLGFHLGRVRLELGPSLDVFAIPLCDKWCQREHGLAAGGHLGAVLFANPGSRFAAGTTVHLTYIPGIAWSGLSVTASAEGAYHW